MRHLQELAAFLSVHLGRRPGIMWAEEDHPAYLDTVTAADLDALADGITRLTGHTARCIRPDDISHVSRTTEGTACTHTLVHQTAGAGSWQLRAAPDTPPTLRCRLLPGEVLYIPPGHTWTTELTAHARYLLTYLDEQS
ncbi:hypothetical protein [Streptomyces sp. NPDC059009]|uniref:hypothetical protein n=1 Tax=Streptomyces sp. NPDC059009 TaxID=3346694 RepID=UPI0036A6B717